MIRSTAPDRSREPLTDSVRLCPSCTRAPEPFWHDDDRCPRSRVGLGVDFLLVIWIQILGETAGPSGRRPNVPGEMLKLGLDIDQYIGDSLAVVISVFQE